MKIEVRNAETNQLLKVIDYNELLKICNGCSDMALDFIRLIRDHPHTNLYNEKWILVEYD